MVTPIGALWLALLLICALESNDSRIPSPLRWIAFATACFIAVALALHVLPGFDNPRWLNEVKLSDASAAFTQYLNFDKAAAGLILLASFAPRTSSLAEIRAVLRAVRVTAIVTASVVAATAVAFGMLRFDPKLPNVTPGFLAVNLLFVCVAEEAFFRGVVQERLRQLFGIGPASTPTVIGFSALMFGVAHAGGGLRYALLATLAGAGYAYAYEKTRRIEAPIVVHFATNALHFFLFTYPFSA